MVKSNDVSSVKVVKVGEDTTKKKKRKKGKSSSQPIVFKQGRTKKPEEPKVRKKKEPAVKEKGPDLRRKLDPLREQLGLLVDQANKRVRDLEKSGIKSRALEEAKRSFNRLTSRKGEEDYFRANLKTRQQINREFARVQTFMADYTSTPEGAENIISNIRNLKGAFGGQWFESTGENYDTTRVDKDIAKEAFEFYRLTLEQAGGWERAIGIIQGSETLAGYGSENLIIAIYDMVANAREDKFDYSKIISTARDIIETGSKNYATNAAKQISDEDYNLIFNDETAEDRQQYHFSSLNWRKRR